ncbi:acyl transferase 1-like [Phragmites australis]|uniref:acyl transferase 1-like n=1 Tax=Phragmites australis TaxID=29695 RepID=UPI002D79E9F4|nr:acyl transferase 1-like [Phragmites australis]
MAVTFTTRRHEAELVTPAAPTPRELKYLSDIDNQSTLRFYATIVQFFRSQPANHNQRPHRDPVAAIRSALAEALVYYYPVAGRLRELPPDGRLVVECTAEGVVFVEADADVSLAQLGEPLLPPYPCVEELLCDLGDSGVVVGKPLAFFQVTRFSSGGFAVGVHFCHNMFDGFGLIQFIEAVGDLARGEAQPTMLPVWERELLTSHDQPRITHANLAYEPLSNGAAGTDDAMQMTRPGDMVGRYFFFGPAEIAALRSNAPAELARSSTVFEILAAAVWRCRTAALGYAPDQRVRFVFTCNARGRWKRHPPIPRGYYGNAMVFLVAETTAAELCNNPLGYTLQLVRKAKFDVNDEYVTSAVDMMALRKWPPLVT